VVKITTPVDRTSCLLCIIDCLKSRKL